MDRAAEPGTATTGTLYVVATPIGNLNDGSTRARDILAQVAVIAAEDTRHSQTLLDAWGVRAALLSLHEHNEERRIARLLERLQAGDDVALISDAGTPLIADPGYRLVRAVREAGVPIRPVPGPCALVAALSVAGLPSDRFLFLGFLPARARARQRALEALRDERATLVCYESPRRLADCLADAEATLGAAREAWVGRELTKRFETHYHGTLAELAAQFRQADTVRGECVLVIAGAERTPSEVLPDSRQLLRELLTELPASRAARLAARLTGGNRQALYQQALELSRQ